MKKKKILFTNLIAEAVRCKPLLKGEDSVRRSANSEYEVGLAGFPASALCKHCGGEIAIRNPTGKCDHLYWPNMLTDEAKQANGFRLVTRQEWER